jgi:ligand-binding SRPBCC domain-containing protein
MRDYTKQPITESATIHASIERVFALSCRVELVKETLGMNLVGGVTSGFIEGGSRVVWRGWKFGLPTEHHTLITGYAAPHSAAAGELRAVTEGQPVAWFQDSQEKGRFAFFRHDHFFREDLHPTTGMPVTNLYDEVRFALPFGFLGELATKLLLAPYVQQLCKKRFTRLKGLAEGDGWMNWLQQ